MSRLAAHELAMIDLDLMGRFSDLRNGVEVAQQYGGPGDNRAPVWVCTWRINNHLFQGQSRSRDRAILRAWDAAVRRMREEKAAAAGAAGGGA